MLDLSALLDEYRAAQAYSIALVERLDDDQVAWRPSEHSSAIGWHLGHQAAVNHYMVRNLTAAEVTFNQRFDAVFDSATPEPGRGDIPGLEEITAYRDAISASTLATVKKIDTGDVGAPAQLRLIATGMLVGIINHEYQHAKWIGEVRATMLDDAAPRPATTNLVVIDGYYTIRTD